MAEMVGRAEEQRSLERARDSPDAELIAIHGRRRVGKTFLVREFFRADIAFELTGSHGAPLREQLANFAAALGRAMRARLPPAPPRDWVHAFQQLVSYVESLPKRRRKRVLFFDELPWLASPRSGFLRAFEHFWNAWAAKQALVVVVCGSASAWITRRILHAKGGLHNRVTRRIRLAPFTLAETESYLASRNLRIGRYQTLELYMALGGIPFYLQLLERGESAAASIDRLCFASDGPLRDEFSMLYASLFEHFERHEQIVRALAARPYGLTRNGVLRETGMESGGTLTRSLEELAESGFILRMPRFGYDAKEAVFRLVDEYSLFYLKWIERYRGRTQNAWLSRRGSPAWRAWSGHAFEGICLSHVGLLKRALGIEAVETQESTWQHRADDEHDRGAQIDLVIDRKDATINLCEMKFSESEFVVDKRYAAELRSKRDVFQRETATRKATIITMVTTYGVRDNAWRREVVDKELDMGALFGG